MSEVDRTRVLAARNGDKRAFGLLARDHLAPVLAIARAFAPDHGTAEDIAQTALLRAWKSLGRLENPERFGPWLRVIARNTARNWLRDRKPERPFSPDAPEPEDPRAPQAASAQDERVAAAVDELPDDLREVIRLRYTSDLTYAEIAETLEIPIGRVRDRLYRAKQTLKQQLGQNT